MSQPRNAPYIWATWLTGLLAGDEQCRWKAWFKANHRYTKLERGNADLATWKAEHGQMVRARAQQLRDEGWLVSIEDQNSFKVLGKTGITLSGKPDVVAVREKVALVVDGKTGRRRASDIQQVFIYQFALPLFRHPALSRNPPLAGEVQYVDGSVPVPAEAFTPSIRAAIVNTITEIGGPTPPARVPSASECAFCDIGPADCPDRIEQVETIVAVEDF